MNINNNDEFLSSNSDGILPDEFMEADGLAEIYNFGDEVSHTLFPSRIHR